MAGKSEFDAILEHLIEKERVPKPRARKPKVKAAPKPRPPRPVKPRGKLSKKAAKAALEFLELYCPPTKH